jgi:hypothetical protein
MAIEGPARLGATAYDRLVNRMTAWSFSSIARAGSRRADHESGSLTDEDRRSTRIADREELPIFMRKRLTEMVSCSG